MAEINVVIPGDQEPGYLKRMVKLAEIQEAMHVDKRDFGDVTVATLRKLIAFIAGYVEVDEGVDAVEVLMDLNKDDYMGIVDAIGAVSVPKGSDTASKDTSEEA